MRFQCRSPVHDKRILRGLAGGRQALQPEFFGIPAHTASGSPYCLRSRPFRRSRYRSHAPGRSGSASGRFETSCFAARARHTGVRWETRRSTHAWFGSRSPGSRRYSRPPSPRFPNQKSSGSSTASVKVFPPHRPAAC